MDFVQIRSLLLGASSAQGEGACSSVQVEEAAHILAAALACEAAGFPLELSAGRGCHNCAWSDEVQCQESSSLDCESPLFAAWRPAAPSDQADELRRLVALRDAGRVS